MLHVPTSVLREMCKRFTEYTITSNARVAVGTYNVNGGKHFRSVVYKDVSLSDWLLDAPLLARTQSLVDVTHGLENEIANDIYAIGFEEIVDLNAGNIVAASSENAKAWGNKGAVAIRCVFQSTSLCFVCAHFAAGQSQVSERNADYAEITRKITFPMGRTLNSHDYIFWCGDFNYRVDMDKEEMKELIKKSDFTTVLQNDQLQIQKQAGNVFKNYFEGDITFPPTYKYDLFSDDYDTSEKCRTPAWTDRVLWKRRKHIPDTDLPPGWSNGKLVHYGRAELKQSDHRPVIAIFDLDIFQVDDVVRSQVFMEVLKDLGPPDATVVIQVERQYGNEEVFDDDFIMALLQELSQIGEVILVRFVETTILVTFRDGQCALVAANMKSAEVCGNKLCINLKTPDWCERAKRELELCLSNTVALCEGDVLVNESAELESAYEKCVKVQTLVGSSSKEVQNKIQERPSPPGRPPLPSASKSTASVPSEIIKHIQKAGVISIKPQIKDMTVTNNTSEKQVTVPENSLTEEYYTAIYEEIHDGDLSDNAKSSTSAARTAEYQSEGSVPPPLPQRQFPMLPPRQQPTLIPDRTIPPPPVPSRIGIPPPVPARSTVHPAPYSVKKSNT